MDRKRVGFLTAVIAMWTLVLFSAHPQLAPSRKVHAPRAADAQLQPSEPSAQRESRVAPPIPLSGVPPARPSWQPADLIADVQLDKSQVCPGEDVLVSITGKPENARSALPIAELNFNIDGKFGDRIALVTTPSETGRIEHTVVASNGVDKIEHRRFQIEVLPANDAACVHKAYATLALQRLQREADAVVAHVVAVHGLAEGLGYDWDFGDGSTARTREPSATHSYVHRDQLKAKSSFLVTVTVTDATGRAAQARDSIFFINNYVLARAFGDRRVPVSYDAQPQPGRPFPSFEVTFHNMEHDPIAFTRATLTEKSCFAGEEDRVHQLKPLDLGVPGALEPKAELKTVLTLPRNMLAPHTCVVQLALGGDSLPARTGTPLENSPVKFRAATAELEFELRAAPAADKGGAPELASRVVTDPALLAKLARASQVLGTERVSAAKLAQLQREGSLE